MQVSNSGIKVTRGIQYRVSLARGGNVRRTKVARCHSEHSEESHQGSQFTARDSSLRFAPFRMTWSGTRGFCRSIVERKWIPAFAGMTKALR